MRAIYAPILALLTVAVFIGCEGPEPSAEIAAPGGEDGSPSLYAYEVVLGNAVTDTLRGDAVFGRMVDPETGDQLLVIRLRSGFDFAGGIVIAKRKPDLPEPGTFTFAAAADTFASSPEGEFIMLYREGMLRNLRSSGGTLTLSTVTDTLIAGRFNATMTGLLAQGTRRLSNADIYAFGRFRAKSGSPGYFIGL